MNQIIAIAVGGSLGAVARYGVSTSVYALLGKHFPYGTLAVNVLGSLFIGILYILLTERLASSPEVRAIILIGFLGSFTTFSTFSLETLTLIEQTEWLKAGLNIVLSIVSCLMATWFGMLIARSI